MSKHRPPLSEKEIADLAASLPQGQRTVSYTSEQLASSMPKGPRTASYTSEEIARSMPARKPSHVAALEAEEPAVRSK